MGRHELPQLPNNPGPELNLIPTPTTVMARDHCSQFTHGAVSDSISIRPLHSSSGEHNNTTEIHESRMVHPH